MIFYAGSRGNKVEGTLISGLDQIAGLRFPGPQFAAAECPHCFPVRAASRVHVVIKILQGDQVLLPSLPRQDQICFKILFRIGLKELHDRSLLAGVQMVSVFWQDPSHTLHYISGVLTDLLQESDAVLPVRPFKDRVKKGCQVLLKGNCDPGQCLRSQERDR